MIGQPDLTHLLAFVHAPNFIGCQRTKLKQRGRDSIGTRLLFGVIQREKNRAKS
jgi:hypothetical protein